MKQNYLLQVAVCEDTASDAAQLVEYIENSGFSSRIHSFKSGESFLASFKSGCFDIIFMDIYISGEKDTGLEIAKKIRQSDKFVILVFTTSSLAHTLESYRLNAIKYLEKPLSAKDVSDSLEIALLKQKTRKTFSLAIAGGAIIELLLDDILFFEHLNHVVMVHTATSGIIKSSQSARLDDIEKRLPLPPFYRSHRSFIVNLNYVQKIDIPTHSFTMVNGSRADINQKKKLRECEEILQLWMAKKTRLCII